MPKQPTSLNSLSRDLFAPCDDGQVLVKDSSQVSGVAPANNGAGGNPFDQDLNTDDLPQFAGLGIGTPGVSGELRVGDDGMGFPLVRAYDVGGGLGAVEAGIFSIPSKFQATGDLFGSGLPGVYLGDGNSNAWQDNPGFGRVLLGFPASENALLSVYGAVPAMAEQEYYEVFSSNQGTFTGTVTNYYGYVSWQTPDGNIVTGWAFADEGGLPSKFDAGAIYTDGAGALTTTGSVSASGYLVGANPGVTGTVTTASLVGMTMNFENGIYMGLT